MLDTQKEELELFLKTPLAGPEIYLNWIRDPWDNSTLFCTFSDCLQKCLAVCAEEGISFDLHTYHGREAQEKALYHMYRLSVRMGWKFDIYKVSHVFSETMRELSGDNYETLLKWLVNAGYSVWKIEKREKKAKENPDNEEDLFFVIALSDKDEEELQGLSSKKEKGLYYYQHADLSVTKEKI